VPTREQTTKTAAQKRKESAWESIHASTGDEETTEKESKARNSAGKAAARSDSIVAAAAEAAAEAVVVEAVEAAAAEVVAVAAVASAGEADVKATTGKAGRMAKKQPVQQKAGTDEKPTKRKKRWMKKARRPPGERRMAAHRSTEWRRGMKRDHHGALHAH